MTTVPAQDPTFDDMEVLADWDCPVCGRATPIICRPGRPRVYCTNACRQRAYRWRKAHGVRLVVTPWRPAERAHNFRQHAVRPPSDFVGRPRDHRDRQVAVCGAFARPASLAKPWHTEFVPGAPSACVTCTALIGADPAWFELYPVISRDPATRLWHYHPPAERVLRDFSPVAPVLTPTDSPPRAT